MPSENPNAAGYNDRLQLVRDLFNITLRITPLKIEVIAYDDKCPFPYNNFIFVVSTDLPPDSENRLGKQPGTSVIPGGQQKFVLRLANSQAAYNNEVRVENEVAALQLAREAMEANLRNIVPRVFAWDSAAGDKQGWMLQEYMPGESLSLKFPEMELDDQRKILGQMAEILQKLQSYEIPPSVRGYGGLTFDGTGKIVIGPMSTMQCGPFETYDQLVLGTIWSKLADADKNKRINGWADNSRDIRSRLGTYLKTGFRTSMAKFDERNPRLVHADLSTDNLLYDPSTMRLTGLLDFDFAHIGTVADEFFRSLGHGIGRFPDPREGTETLPLNKAMLEGFPNPLPHPTEEIEWPQAKLWDDALQVRYMHRPGNIRGMQDLSCLFWLSAQILPFKLCWEIIAENSGEDAVRSWKSSGENLLDEFLKEQGY